MLPKTTFDCHTEYRLKPRTIKIGNREITAPESKAPNEGQTYYTPSVVNSKLYYEILWSSQGFDNDMLHRNLVFLTKEDAIAVTKAMLELLKAGDK